MISKNLTKNITFDFALLYLFSSIFHLASLKFAEPPSGPQESQVPNFDNNEYMAHRDKFSDFTYTYVLVKLINYWFRSFQ